MIHDPPAPDSRRARLVAPRGFARYREAHVPGPARARTDRGAAGACAAHASGGGSPSPESPPSVLCGWLSSWRATFYVTGREHSPTGATGSAFEATPFRAVQAAAWETLARA